MPRIGFVPNHITNPELFPTDVFYWDCAYLERGAKHCPKTALILRLTGSYPALLKLYNKGATYRLHTVSWTALAANQAENELEIAINAGFWG